MSLPPRWHNPGITDEHRKSNPLAPCRRRQPPMDLLKHSEATDSPEETRLTGILLPRPYLPLLPPGGLDDEAPWTCNLHRRPLLPIVTAEVPWICDLLCHPWLLRSAVHPHPLNASASWKKSNSSLQRKNMSKRKRKSWHPSNKTVRII